jgi:Flp pilus assembly pilin Flp
MSDTDLNTSPAQQGQLRCEQGQTLVEYALILMFVSIAAIGLTPVGQWVALRLTGLAGALGGA